MTDLPNAPDGATAPADPRRGEVEIDLDGRRYLLRPSFQALAEIEAATGCGIMTLVRRFADKSFGFNDVTAVVAAGLKAAGRPLPRERVGEAVFRSGLLKAATPVSGFLWNALGAGLPEADAAADGAAADGAAADGAVEA